MEISEAVEKGRNNPAIFAREILGVDLNPLQEKWFTEVTKEGRKRCILVPSNQCGKFNPVSEPVLTPNGFVRMGDIKPGSIVFSETGEQTEVLQIFPQGKQPIYKLTFDDESWSLCGLEHLWKVMTPSSRFSKNFNDDRITRKRIRTGIKKDYPNKGYQQWSVMDTKTIIERWGMNPKPGNRIAIPVTEPVQFDKKFLPVDPYVIGVLLGDGCISHSQVKVTSADPEIIQYIRDAGFDVEQSGKPIDYAVRGIRPFLSQIGIHGNRSWEKHIPKDYLINSVENRIELLRGLMDTDGSVSTTGGAMEYTTVSKQLAEDVKFLVQSLGGKVETRTRKTSFTYNGKKKLGRLSYRLRIKIRINPFRLKRKFDKFIMVTKYKPYRVLRKIEYVRDEESQCIYVQHPTHTYLTRDFIVTHNTLASAILHIWHAFYKPRLRGTQDQRLTATYPTLNISPNSNQMREMFKYMLEIVSGELLWTDPKTGETRTNDSKIKWFLKKSTENPMPIIFWENGSITYGRSVHDDRGKGLAGGQYAYITYDECVLSHHLKDEVTGNIYSRLIKYNGDLHLIGTPNSESPSNQYYMHIVKKGLEEKEGWFAMRGKLDDNIFFTEKDRDEIKKNLRQMNPDQYRQVVYGDFVDAASGYFSPEQVDKLFRDDLTWEDFVPGHHYILSIDWAIAKNDYTVMMVIDFTTKPYRVVKINRFQGHEFKPQEQYAIARGLQREYEADFITDASGLGGAIIKEELADIVTQAFTFGGSGQNKQEMLLYLKEMLAVGDLICPFDPELAEELGTYKEDDKRLVQDMVMALGMASWYIKENYTEENKKGLLELNIFR